MIEDRQRRQSQFKGLVDQPVIFFSRIYLFLLQSFITLTGSSDTTDIIRKWK